MPGQAAICPTEVNTSASGPKASGCLEMKALALSALREHTATALNLGSWTAPFKIQSLMRPVPIIPKRTNA